MKIILDECISPRCAAALVRAGIDAQHCRALVEAKTSDQDLLQVVHDSNAALVTCDSDHNRILAMSGASAPTVIFFHQVDYRLPEQQATLIKDVVGDFAGEIEAGSIIAVAGDGTIRVRPLPI